MALRIGGWWRLGSQVILCLTLSGMLCDDRYDVWTKDFGLGRVGWVGTVYWFRFQINFYIIPGVESFCSLITPF
jgi:hypothetical protein